MAMRGHETEKNHHGLETPGALFDVGGGDPRGHLIYNHALEARGDLLRHQVLKREAGGHQKLTNRGIGGELQLANELVELKDDVDEPSEVLERETSYNARRENKIKHNGVVPWPSPCMLA